MQGKMNADGDAWVKRLGTAGKEGLLRKTCGEKLALDWKEWRLARNTEAEGSHFRQTGQSSGKGTLKVWQSWSLLLPGA